MAAYIFKNTMEKSAFRRLIVAWFVCHIGWAWYNNDTAAAIAQIPRFAAELAICLAKRVVRPTKPILSNDSEVNYEGSKT